MRRWDNWGSRGRASAGRPGIPEDRSPGVIDVAIEAREPTGFEELVRAAERLVADDRGLDLKVDPETFQIILSGGSEIHLDVAVERLRERVTFNVGALQISYRETITQAVEHDFTHKKQSAAIGEFARIKFAITPEPGFRFASRVRAGELQANSIAAVELGVRSALKAGPLIGFPIIDVAYTLIGGSERHGHSSAEMFEAAARVAFREAFEKGSPVVLEPIMDLEVVVSELHIGDVIADLNSRRAQIRGVAPDGLNQSVEVKVPLETMFGYVNSLRALTRGQGRYEMSFSHYEKIPQGFDPLDPDGRFPPAMAMRA